MHKKKVIILVGARPNFMKAASIYNELKKIKKFNILIVHSGQHYDKEMSEIFFDELNLPKPYIYLGVGSGSHAEQTARVMIEFEKVCVKEKPDLVIVVGDVNTTLAGALTAVKLCIPVVHVEAGLRSFDRTMPEEINRIIADHVSDFLFTTCVDANRNLIKEGISKDKIFFVGNAMIDSLRLYIKSAKNSDMLTKLGLKNEKGIRKYAVLTLHRPSNVDDIKNFMDILKAIKVIAEKVPVIYPAHPRAMDQLNKLKVKDLAFDNNFVSIPPLGYIEFLCLMLHSALVLTDSGGIQEETTYLGIPCLTLRNNTERPITIRQGTNRLVGTDPEKIIREALSVLSNKFPEKLKKPKYWDGKSAQRICKILYKKLT